MLDQQNNTVLLTFIFDILQAFLEISSINLKFIPLKVMRILRSEKNGSRIEKILTWSPRPKIDVFHIYSSILYIWNTYIFESNIIKSHQNGRVPYIQFNTVYMEYIHFWFKYHWILSKWKCSLCTVQCCIYTEYVSYHYKGLGVAGAAYNDIDKRILGIGSQIFAGVPGEY